MFAPYFYTLRRIAELDIDTTNRLLLVWLGYEFVKFVWCHHHKNGVQFSNLIVVGV
jgi:hypothetical protein